MSFQSNEIIQKLDVLAEKLDVLTKVTAINIQKDTLLKGKTQKEQIKALSQMKLSRNVIAVIVGTTPLTVSVTLSKMKKRKSKAKERQS